MTDYELIDLAISQSELGYRAVESLATVIIIYLSMVTGYLIIAYLVGAALTKGQVAVITAAFLAASGWALIAIFAFAINQAIDQQVAEQLWEQVDKRAIIERSIPSPYWGHAAGIFLLLTLFVGIIAPLYFMRSIRRPSSE